MSSPIFYLPGIAPPPVTVEAAVPAGTIDHVAAAVSRLPQQFKDKANIVALLSLFAQRYNDLEAVGQAFLTMRNIYNAVGVQLDIIGRIVGQPRGALSDADYRRYIFARIATNRSDGVIEDLITIAVLILNDATAQVVIDNQGVAALVMRVQNITVTDSIANILLDFEQAATSAGVRLVLETQYDADSDVWAFALATFCAGSVLAGATTLNVTSTAGFPASGTLNVDEALAVQDLGVTYSGLTPTSFLNVTGLAHAHVDQSEVSLAGASAFGLGMGDTGNPATGGELISARDKHYP